MSDTTELARGNITRAHEITVVLQEPADSPAIILIRWPGEATICTPHQLQATAAKATNILARATIELARIKRDRRL
jgi:hypothetical protein